MNAALLIITCISGTLAFACLLAGYCGLLSQDQSEIDEFQRRYRELSFRGVLAPLRRWRWVRREAPPTPSQIGAHWRSRPQVRRLICLGLIFFIIALITGHFSSFPK